MPWNAAIVDLHLPVETPDSAVDHLHNAKDGLKHCCLAPKSWIPRTRSTSLLKSGSVREWTYKRRFQTLQSLLVCFSITSMGLLARRFAVTFSPLHGFSPFIKSLRITSLGLLPSQVFDLILSFPLPGDLTVVAGSEVIPHGRSSLNGLPSTLPMLTGSLEIFHSGG